MWRFELHPFEASSGLEHPTYRISIDMHPTRIIGYNRTPPDVRKGSWAVLDHEFVLDHRRLARDMMVQQQGTSWMLHKFMSTASKERCVGGPAQTRSSSFEDG